MYRRDICVYIEIDFIDDDDDDTLPSRQVPITADPPPLYTRVVYMFDPKKCLTRVPYPMQSRPTSSHPLTDTHSSVKTCVYHEYVVRHNNIYVMNYNIIYYVNISTSRRQQSHRL